MSKVCMYVWQEKRYEVRKGEEEIVTMLQKKHVPLISQQARRQWRYGAARGKKTNDKQTNRQQMIEESNKTLEFYTERNMKPK